MKGKLLKTANIASVLWVVCILAVTNLVALMWGSSNDTSTTSPFLLPMLSFLFLGVLSFAVTVSLGIISFFLKGKSKVFIPFRYVFIAAAFILFGVFCYLYGFRTNNISTNTSTNQLIQHDAITPQQVIKLTNDERAKVGVIPLTENNALDTAAKAKFDDMVANNYWEHVSPAGKAYSDFIKEAGYYYDFAGENLGKGFDTNSALVSAWMFSEKHRENILSPKYTEIGVYAGKATLLGEEEIIVVQEFGKPLSQSQTGTLPTSGLSILEVKSYCGNISNIQPSWENASSKFPPEKINPLLDSLTRQVAFCNTIIGNYEKNNRFSGDDITLWNGIVKMGNETYIMTGELNKQQ